MPKAAAPVADVETEEAVTEAPATETTTPDDIASSEPEIEIDGQKYKAQFSYETFAVLRKKYGDEADMMNPEVLALHALQAIKRNHPMVTLEQIMAASPPMVPVGRAVRIAMNRLFYGDKLPSSAK